MKLGPEISAELRHLVRDVLREAMAQRAAVAGAAVETVRIADDHDLAVLVARIIEPQTLDKLRAGKLRFTLAVAPSASVAELALTGVVTEQKIEKFTAASRLVLASGAVLTPLARDRARRLGLVIERRR